MSNLEMLNQPQQEAVRQTEGPLLILAGAGSGKTRVLTHRIAYLIEQCGVNPWNILAITFTNKAAGEMRERVDRLVGSGADQIWVSTFHSTCARILRRYIDRIGYDRNYTIYDTDDSRQVMKTVIRQLDLNPKIYKERGLLAKISAAKNELISPEQFERDHISRWEERQIAAAYHAYQDTLRRNNALDFDDLLVRTVDLFRNAPEVLEMYQDRFRYIMIDEYQDTNTAQFALVRLLAAKYRNLCVVGDDDQSIYKFRGANIRNILNFEYEYPEAQVIRLEQNYRSTQQILDAANGVITNNVSRKQKTLWTDLGKGSQIQYRRFENGYEEAEFVARDIRGKTGKGRPYSDFAVLYRTNAQSRLFEEAFISLDIPYKIVGGINFYARKEIKDVLSYLKTIDNASDDLACIRIINVPRRGIGETTIGRVAAFAAQQEISFYDALLRVEEIPNIGRAAAKIKGFTNLIQRYREALREMKPSQLLEYLLEETEYTDELEAEETPEADARLENIGELMAKLAEYEAGSEEPTLTEFLQMVSLVADIDSVEGESDYVLLMTLHSAKGLEFESVYMAGMEDGIFPGYMSINAEDTSELEEERRLCYVGITRAKRELTLTSAAIRMVRGQRQPMKTSRFIREIPRELVAMSRDSEYTMKREEKRQAADFFGGAGISSDSSYMSARPAQMSDFPAPGIGFSGGRAQKRKPQPFQMREFKVTKADRLEYGIGDRVRHVKFGEGTVTQIAEGGKDYEVTVAFDNHGVRRMFASFAKLQRC